MTSSSCIIRKKALRKTTATNRFKIGHDTEEIVDKRNRLMGQGEWLVLVLLFSSSCAMFTVQGNDWSYLRQLVLLLS